MKEYFLYNLLFTVIIVPIASIYWRTPARIVAFILSVLFTPILGGPITAILFGSRTRKD